MKKIIPFLSLFILLSAFTCENEPLDDDVVVGQSTSETTNTLSCFDAVQQSTNAAQDFAGVTPSDNNYETICNAYAVAIQNQINSCGDPGGAFQGVLDNLDCNANQANTCEEAMQTSESAAAMLANATAANYTNLCNSYKMALEAEIVACGDSNGNIQLTIDALGDCLNNSNNQEFYAEIDGVEFIEESMSITEVNIAGGLIQITATRNGSETFALRLDSDITSGMYNFQSLLQAVNSVQYTTPSNMVSINNSYEGDGTFEIVSHNTVTKQIEGTFEFIAEPQLGSTSTLNFDITNGSFNISY